MRRLPLLLAGLALAAAATAAVVASPEPSVTLSRAAAQAGDTTTATGRGFPPGATGTLVLGGATVRVATDDDGRFVAEVPVDGVPGPLTATATVRGRRAGAAFTVRPDRQHLAFGVSTPGGPSAGHELDAVAAQVGEQPSLVLSYTDFTRDLDRAGVEAVLARGATPLLTWEPWVAGAGVEQPAFSLRSLAEGAHDAYLSRFGAALAAVDAPVLLRPAHEMNGDWYPWSEARNGAAPGDYVAAWRHVHDVVTAAGATQVRWVWSPNVPAEGTLDLAGLWPGEAYVDVVGIDGYNWGTSRPDTVWQSPREVLGPGLAAVRVLAPGLPVLVAETASAEQGGDKAAWAADLVRYLDAQPDVAGVVWFDHAKEADWRLASSPASVAALRQALGARTPLQQAAAAADAAPTATTGGTPWTVPSSR